MSRCASLKQAETFGRQGCKQIRTAFEQQAQVSVPDLDTFWQAVGHVFSKEAHACLLTDGRARRGGSWLPRTKTLLPLKHPLAC